MHSEVSDHAKGWQRWQEHLAVTSEAYRRLKAEQVAGWSSPSLDAFYKKDKDTAAPRHTQRQAGTTAFHDADTERQAKRYRDHVARIFAGDPLLSQSVGMLGKRTFLDLGASPGGVTRYFHDDLGWVGTAVSLAERDGGIRMEPPKENPKHYIFVEGSILDDTLGDMLQNKARLQLHSCDFCNAGAVQDYGQRADEASETAPPADTTHLPWIAFLAPQLKMCLQFVKPGGSVMFVFGLSDCGSLMLLLHYLGPMVRGGIHVLPTMHVAKSPVYVLLSNVHYDEASYRDLSAALERPKGHWLLHNDADFTRASAQFDGVVRRSLEDVWREREEKMRSKREFIEKSHEGNKQQKRSRLEGI